MDAKRIGRSPAFPTGTGLDDMLSGLTKREFFAAMAMQGLCSHGMPYAEGIARFAVDCADALLKDLAK